MPGAPPNLLMHCHARFSVRLLGAKSSCGCFWPPGLQSQSLRPNSTTWPWWPGGSGKGTLALGCGHHLAEGWRKNGEIKNGASTRFTIGRQRAAGAVTGKAGSGRAVWLPGQIHACGRPALSMGHGFGGESHHSRTTPHKFRAHCSTCDKGEGRAIAHSPRPCAFGYK